MHLMVLGASRLTINIIFWATMLSLNAPDGAGCFPTPRPPLGLSRRGVSMHLMVLGASRPGP